MVVMPTYRSLYPRLVAVGRRGPGCLPGFAQTLGSLRNRPTGPLSEQRVGAVSKRAEYAAKAAEHSHLAETCQSEEARKVHRDLAEWFLLLADDGWLDPIPEDRLPTRRYRDRPRSDAQTRRARMGRGRGADQAE